MHILSGLAVLGAAFFLLSMGTCAPSSLAARLPGMAAPPSLSTRTDAPPPAGAAPPAAAGAGARPPAPVETPAPDPSPDSTPPRDAPDASTPDTTPGRDTVPPPTPASRADSTPPSPPTTVVKTVVVGSVNFSMGSTTLSPTMQRQLEAVAASLVEQPGRRVEVVGYTDATGSWQRNATLARDRAEAVRDFLVGRGVDPTSIDVRAVGARGFVGPNRTPDGRASNRRVEVHFIG